MAMIMMIGKINYIYILSDLLRSFIEIIHMKTEM